MPRRPRLATGGLAYHVFEPSVGRLALFEKPAALRKPTIAQTCVSPLLFDAESLASLLWPQSDGELSEVMRWITVTHTQRWHAHHHSSGSGPVYHGRSKSFPVQTNEHFITVARYIERNALRAKLVDRGEEWRWSSVFQFKQNGAAGFNFLTQGPMERPQN